MPDTTLTLAEVAALADAFPELSWMKPEDWQRVASFADWRTWLDDVALNEEPRPSDWPDYDGILERLLQKRKWRIEVRKDCRAYFGIANVGNINDPGDATWA